MTDLVNDLLSWHRNKPRIMIDLYMPKEIY